MKENGFSPLHVSAVSGKTEVVRELIKLGATKSVVAGMYGTPLHQAVGSGHMDTVEAMLEDELCQPDIIYPNANPSDWNIGTCNSIGQTPVTPLHQAVGSGHMDTVEAMLEDELCQPDIIYPNANPSDWNIGTCNSIGQTPVTPLHQAVGSGHMDTVEAMLEDELCQPDIIYPNANPSDWNIGTCNSIGQTPVMWAVRYGLVEVFKLLTTKGGSIFDKDLHSLSTLEQCFLSGHARKLNQFCEASGIRSRGEGLRGALATLITQGLVDAHKVLCLCAFSGDCVFLEDKLIDLISDVCAMPAAVKCAKFYFCRDEGVPFINQLRIPDDNALNPLHISLLIPVPDCCPSDMARWNIQTGRAIRQMRRTQRVTVQLFVHCERL